MASWLPSRRSKHVLRKLGSGASRQPDAPPRDTSSLDFLVKQPGYGSAWSTNMLRHTLRSFYAWLPTPCTLSCYFRSSTSWCESSVPSLRPYAIPGPYHAFLGTGCLRLITPEHQQTSTGNHSSTPATVQADPRDEGSAGTQMVFKLGSHIKDAVDVPPQQGS